MTQVLTALQLILSVLLIISVLLQQKGAGLGAGFGNTGGIQSTRRGPEKIVFNATVIISILLFAISLAVVIL